MFQAPGKDTNLQKENTPLHPLSLIPNFEKGSEIRPNVPIFKKFPPSYRPKWDVSTWDKRKKGS
jgi:hypothetical protein